MNSYLISLILFLPLIGAAALWGHSLFWRPRGVPQDRLDNQYRWIALAFSIVNFLLTLPIIFGFNRGISEPQFATKVPWISNLGAYYFVGIDGINVWMVLLTTFLVPICILVTWIIPHNVRAYLTTLLLLETGLIGVFVSFDLLLFYLFWELTLIPMSFMIGIWGAERERRVPAALKFFIFTVVGSLFMLVGIIAVYYYAGADTFDIVEITQRLTAAKAAGSPLIPGNWPTWLWLAFGLGLFVKIPLWPLHSWQPDAYVQAPTSGSIMLAAVMAKMGAFGLLRFNLPFFPEVSMKFAPYVMALAVIGIIYGALLAMVQEDLKRLVAYSSLSHLGYVVLGIFAFTDKSMQGAIYQMFTHGISTSALFLCVGLIAQRRQTRLIKEFGGVATPMPGYSTMFMVAAFASLGLPLLSGFVGEFLILLGTFESRVPYARVFAILG
ncbi:MAG TPA: NADH-quinone oxidoreductase subunit M, partial [Blastocatellia bacterium]|nr:NADH-quinone oxidoreductase subunit M [Blastocatellia bacterium]